MAFRNTRGGFGSLPQYDICRDEYRIPSLALHFAAMEQQLLISQAAKADIENSYRRRLAGLPPEPSRIPTVPKPKIKAELPIKMEIQKAVDEWLK
jgi:hypothetical protein